MEIELGAEFLEDLLHKIVFAGGDAAAQEQEVRLQAFFNHPPQRRFIVRSDAEPAGRSAGLRHLRLQGHSIAVTDLEPFRLAVNRHDFVAGRKNRHARLTEDVDVLPPDRGQQAEFGRAEPPPFVDNHVPGRGFTPLPHDVLPGLDRPLDAHPRVAFVCLLVHHHRVRAGRKRRSRHDSHALRWSHLAGKAFPCADFTHAVEGCRRCTHIGGTNGVAIAGRAVEGGIVAVGLDVFGQHPVKSLSKWSRFRFQIALDRAEFFPDHRLCLFEGEHYFPGWLRAFSSRVLFIAGRNASTPSAVLTIWGYFRGQRFRAFSKGLGLSISAH